MGFFSTFTIGTGTMIGAGIFILPGLALANAGPASIISFLLGGLISIATAISMAELATGMPLAGGSYYYISRTMGAAFGAVIGLGSWLALIFKGTFALIGLAQYFQLFYPLPLYFVAAATGLLLLAINYRGAKSSGSLQNVIVVLLMAILLLFIAGVSFSIEPANFSPVAPYGAVSVITTTGIIFISYLGLAELAAVSEEVKNPTKNLPRAFIASAVVVTLFYVGIMTAVVGFSGPGGAAMGAEGAAAGVATSVTPLADMADLMAGEYGKIAIALGALLATLSTANGAILSSSRFPFAMSRDALMPEWFVLVHEKYGTPHNAILVTGTVMVVLLFLFDIEELARLGGAFNILIFILLNMAVIILRNRTLPGYEPAFRDPFFPFTQVTGIAGSIILLPLLGFLPFLFILALVSVGAVWYRFYGRGRAMPEYNIFDLLEDTVEKAHIKPDSVAKVLVPISNPAHERDLLKLADCLGSDIICLHVIEVPDQTDLKLAQEAYHEKETEPDIRFKEKFDRYPARIGHKREYIVAFDHNIPNSIIEQAEIEKADMIILGWHETKGFQYYLGEVINGVLSTSKKQIALLKGHLPEKIEKILVAYNGKENSNHALYLAKKMAANTGASIEILRIISPDETPEEKKEVSEKLEDLVKSIPRVPVTFKLLERYSIEDAILEASNHSDLTIIGDSSQRFKVSLLGTLSQRVAIHARKPVMVVKKSKPISKESLNYLMKKYARKMYAKFGGGKEKGKEKGKQAG
nr:amino acid permease [Methanosarcina sp. KYL-1]